MPVILETEDDIRAWLDTSQHGWTSSLSALLKPYEKPLEWCVCIADSVPNTHRRHVILCVTISYVVPKEVGKVSNNSPDFIKVTAIIIIFVSVARKLTPLEIKARGTAQREHRGLLRKAKGEGCFFFFFFFYSYEAHSVFFAFEDSTCSQD
jgi:hypothetical protein